MKVEIITKKNLEHPRLELTIFLDSGQTRLQIKYDCPNCGGYGCHGNKHCDDTINLDLNEVTKTLGEEAKSLLAKVFNQILGEAPSSQ